MKYLTIYLFLCSQLAQANEQNCPSLDKVMDELSKTKDLSNGDIFTKNPEWSQSLSCKKIVLRKILTLPQDPLATPKKPHEKTSEIIAEAREGYKKLNMLLDKIVNPRFRYLFKYLKMGSVKTLLLSKKYKKMTLLYFHGGGYSLGLDHVGNSYIPFLKNLSDEINAEVYMPDYRLVPEHSLDASLDDAYSAYLYLIETKKIDPKTIIISGDSAGGGLALRLMLKLKKMGKNLPGKAILISPWTDKTNSGDSVTTKRNNAIFAKAEAMEQFTPLVLRGMKPRDPLVSPLFGDYTNFPPLLYVVGGSEIFYDDTMRDVEKARRQGVKVDVIEHKDGMHIYPIFARFLPEGKDAVEKIVHWVTKGRR